MRSNRSIPDILSDLTREFTTMIRKDFLLARTEMSEKASMVGGAIAMIAVGAVFLIAAAMLLFQAAVDALVAQGFSELAATLLVGVAALILGAILTWIGVRRLNPENLAPNKTFEQLQREAAVVRQQVRGT